MNHRPKRLIIATSNTGKMAEFTQLLSDLGSDLQSMREVGVHDEIVEDGLTLEENALIKARYLYEQTGENILADDTGLEVRALNWAPGVHSARYAGAEGSAEKNMAKLMAALENEQDRFARFRTVIALILEGREYLFEGKVDGNISHRKQGNAGFGYDPVFIPEGLSQTFGQMSSEEKNAVSHRRRAINSVKEFLATTGLF